MASDIVVFPGFAHFRTLPMHHWLRRLTFKPTLLWSEPFLGHPRAATKGPFHGLIRRFLLQPIHSSKYTLLATGHAAEHDFHRVGMHRWNYRRFAFAVRPRADADTRTPLPVGQDVHILYVGALCRRKGVDVLIEALGSERLREKRWRLTVVGDGDQRDELSAQTERLGVSEKVAFLGSLPQARCEEAYRMGDILVLPSRYDGWGAVVNEAMEYGLAIVTSDRVGARTPLVEHGVNGLVFASEDAGDLVLNIAELVEDRQRLTRMKEASLRRIRLFRPSEVARRLTAICQALAGDAPMPDYTGELCGLVSPDRDAG